MGKYWHTVITYFTVFNKNMCKIIFISLILFFISHLNEISGQNVGIADTFDIKNISVKNSNPSLFNDLAQKKLFNEPEKALVFAEAALKTAILNNNKKEEARAWYYIGNVYNIKGENDKALDAYYKALEIKKMLNDREGLARVLNNIGVIKVNTGDYKTAIEYYNKSLKIKYQLKDTNGIAGTLANIGNIYFLWGKYRESFKYNHTALSLYEMTNNKQGIAACSNHLGAIYENWKDFNSALNSYNTALELETYNRNSDGIANTLNNLGNLYNKMGVYEEALNKYEQSLEIRKKENNLKGIASTLNNIGTLYTQKSEYDKARNYFKQALNISRQINSGYEITVNLYAIGNNYLTLKNYKSARPYFEESLKIASDNNFRELVADNYNALSTIYSNLQMYDKAYLCLQKYMMLKDSIFSKETYKQMAEIKTRYETEKKQKEIELLKRNMLIQQLKSEQREQQLNMRLIIWIAVAGFIILLIFSGAIMLRLNQRRKLIIAEQKALRAQMNPHFIFNAMNSIQGFIMEHNNESARKYLNRFSQLMRNILENSKQTTIPLKEELDTLTLYLELEKLRFSNSFEYNISIDDAIDCEEVYIPPMLIQPLLENAIQHGLLPSNKQGLLELNFLLFKEKYIKIIIKDNGIGREKAAEISQRRINHVSTGMKNIQERISLLSKIHKGNIQMKVIDIIDENNNGIGTQVEIVLPC